MNVEIKKYVQRSALVFLCLCIVFSALNPVSVAAFTFPFDDPDIKTPAPLGADQQLVYPLAADVDNGGNVDPLTSLESATKKDTHSANTKTKKYEEAEKRTATTKTFLNTDGSRTLEYSVMPKHFNKDGKWLELNPKLSEDKNYKPEKDLLDIPFISNPLNKAANQIKATSGEFSASIKPFEEGIEVTYKNKTIKITPQFARNVRPVKTVVNDHEIVTYTDAWPNVDVTYELVGNVLKETLVLKNKSADSTFVYKVSDGTKVTAHPTISGALAFEGVNPDEFFMAPLSINVNKRGIISEQRAKWSFKNQVLVLQLDTDWYGKLKDSDFPVAVDPSFYNDVGGTYGNFIAYKSDGYSCNSQICDPQAGLVYDNGWKAWRTMFRIPFDQLQGGKKVLSASIHLVKKQRSYWTGVDGWRYIDTSWAPCFGFNCTHDPSYTHGAGANTNDWSDVRNTVAWMAGENNPSPQWGGWFMMWGDEGTESYKQFEPTSLGMSVVYDTPTPQPTSIEPLDNQVVVDTQPSLKVNPVVDADGDSVSYKFIVTTNKQSPFSGIIASSDFTGSTQWTIPDNILQDGTTYYWGVSTKGATETAATVFHPLKVDMRTGKDSTQAYDTVGPIGIDLATGNATTSASTHTMNALGGSLGLTFDYNSPGKSRRGLVGEYFNNTTYSGTPALTRVDSNIEFAWQSGSPSSLIQNDNFSAKWSGYFVAPETGSYQFGAQPDDAAKITVNGQVVLDVGCCTQQWSSSQVSLTAGQVVPVIFQFTEVGGHATSYFLVKTPNNSHGQVVPSEWLQTGVRSTDQSNGLTGRYYTDDGSHNFPTNQDDPSRLMMVRQDTASSLNWGLGGPAPGLRADNFMVRWKGYFTVPESATAGAYKFGGSSDDGMRIKLGIGAFGTDVTVYDKWVVPAGSDWSGATYNLTPGMQVPITIEYFEVGGGASMAPYVQGPNLAAQIIPTNWLSSAAQVVPSGWQLGVDADGNINYERIRVTTSAAILSDSTGETHEYKWENNAYKAPVNENGVLVKTSDNKHTLTDVDGRVYVFGTDGKLESVTTPQDDRQPAALRYEYSGDPSRLIKIVDGVTDSRFATVHYKGFNEQGNCSTPAGFDAAPTGMICAFKTSDGDLTKIYYKSGRLSRIEKPGTEFNDYGYDTIGRILTIRDSVANDTISYNVRTENAELNTEVTYDALGRASTIKAPAPSQGAARLTHTFEYLPGSVHPISRFYQPAGPTTHIASKAYALPGIADKSVFLYAYTNQQPGTRAVYSCQRQDGRYFAGSDPLCFGNGNTSKGIQGYLYEQPTGEATVPLSRIRASDGYVLEYPATSLAGWTTEEIIGYGYTKPVSSGFTRMHVMGTSEPYGFSKQVEYDNLLRTIKDTDVFGLSTQTEWDPVKDLTLSRTDSSGLKSTILYDAMDRQIDNYGGAPAAWFGSDRKPVPLQNSSVPRTSTSYDQGMTGLSLSSYNNKNLTGSPKLFSTGFSGSSTASQALELNTNGLNPTDGASYRATGKILLAELGLHTFRAWHSDGVRVYIDDQLIVNDWADGAERYSPTANYNNSKANNWVNISIETYKTGTSGRVFTQLLKAAPGSTENANIAPLLAPNYSLTTSTKAYDAVLGDVETQTIYNKPEYGLADKTILDPTGLAYESNATYETPGTGFLRQTSKTLPGGGTTTYAHYGKEETRQNPCIPNSPAVHQGGRPKIKTEADPDGAGNQAARSSETVYSVSGDIVATRYNNDPWTCTTYDSRGRVAQSSVPMLSQYQPARTITNNYVVAGNPLVTSTSDNTGTITVENDLLGRTIKYIDVHSNITLSTYNTQGLLMSRSGPLGSEEFVYDQYDRLVDQKLDGTVYAHVTYDQFGRTDIVTYPAAGQQKVQYSRDSLGRTSAITYTVATSSATGQNLVLNSSFESSSGSPAAPSGWISNAWGNNTAMLTYENSGRTGSKSVKAELTSHVDGDAKWMFDPVNVSGNTSYTFANYYKSTAWTNVLVRYTHQDSSVTWSYLGAKGPSSSWVQNTYEFTTPTTAVNASVVHIMDAVGWLQIDDVDLHQTTVPSSTTTVSDTVSYSVSGDIVSGNENGTIKSYAYDNAGRLTNATIGSNNFVYDFTAPTASQCSQASANLNSHKNGNRTKMIINGEATTYCYDIADKLISSSDQAFSNMEYDSHGNMTRLGSTLRPAYDSSDRNRGIEQYDGSGNGHAIYYSRDVQDRIVTRHKDNIVGWDWQAAGTSHYGFTGSGDTPDFVKDSNGVIQEKYILLAGDILMTIRPQQAGINQKNYSLPNIHDDVFAVTNAFGELLSTHLTGPFGEKINGQVSPINTVSGTTFSYVGQHEKITETEFAAHLVQMGARVYVPSLGRFTAVDPIEGGTDNNYSYANDPVNQSDLDGKFIPLVIGAVMLASTIHSAYEAHKNPSPVNVGMLALSAIPGGGGAKLGIKAVGAMKSAAPTLTKKIANFTAKAAVKPYSRTTGINSKLFGSGASYKYVGTVRKGILNNNNILRMGWQGNNHKNTVFRAAMGPSPGYKSKLNKYNPVKYIPHKHWYIKRR